MQVALKGHYSFKCCSVSTSLVYANYVFGTTLIILNFLWFRISLFLHATREVYVAIVKMLTRAEGTGVPREVSDHLALTASIGTQ